MKQLTILVFFFCIDYSAFSQQESKFSVEINYGLNGNFFVRSYDELGGPDNKAYYYKKNFIGSIAGLNFQYKINGNNALFMGYERSINIGKKNAARRIDGIDVFIEDFKLRHIDNIYFLGYGYLAKVKKSNLKIEAGLTIITDAQQTLGIENWDGYVSIEERNYKNSNMIQGGTFVGFGFSRKIDTKFELGIKSRVYYLISVSSFEAVTLTPTLSYTF